MSRQYSSTNQKPELLFGARNFITLVAGLVLIVLGFILMSGGKQPDPDTWNADEIYSSTRITLAPFVVVLGLCVIVAAIFLPKGKKTEITTDETPEN